MVRNAGRLLAPLAIAAVAVGAFVIVDSNLGSHRHPRPIVRTSAQQVRLDRRRPRSHARGGPTTFYTVRAGDTMSEIATRTGVSLARLESLNPALAPTYTLHAGQRLRLRR